MTRSSRRWLRARTKDGDIERQYMICGVKDAKWVVLEGFEYGAEGL